MKAFLVVVFVTIVVENGMCVMTDAQMKSAGRLIRNVCQPKTKVTNADIDKIHKGEFTEDPAIMCYTECVLRMGQIIKDGKLNLQSALAQIETSLPPELAAATKLALDNCKDSITSSEKCTAAHQFYKCYYEFNPEKFFLP